MDPVQVVFAILAAVGLPAGIVFLNRYRKLRGARIVTCPETHQPVAVNVNAARGAGRSLAGVNRIDLRSCTRWPEKRDCGQECRHEIDTVGPECLVRNIVRRQYAGRECVYCGRPFGNLLPFDHRPGLRTPGASPIQWSSIPPETLPRAFETHQLVCWDCLIAESFRSEHPDLVTERPARNDA